MTFLIDKQPFQTIKTSIFKSHKICIFFVKNCKFSQVFFLVKICQINCLVTFYIEKQAFQTIETLITKSRKICIFPKGPWFFSKIAIFLIFSFYLKNGEQKSLMTFYIGKQAFLDYKNMVLNKSQYCIFPKLLVYVFC